MEEFYNVWFVVNDKWSNKKDSDIVKADGDEFVIGQTAFASLEALIFSDAYAETGCDGVDFLSKKTVLNDAWLTQNPGVLEKINGTISLDADLGSAALELYITVGSTIGFEDFSTVSVGKGGYAESIVAENDSDTYYKNYSLKNYKSTAFGKITVKDGGSVGTIENYKNVTVSGKGTEVNKIVAADKNNTYNEGTGYGDAGRGKQTAVNDKAAGTVVINNEAEVESVENYSKVTVDNASVCSVSGGSAENSFMMENGKWEIYQGEADSLYSQISVSNKINLDKKSGSNTVDASLKLTSTITLSNNASVTGAVNNFSTVTVAKSEVGGDICLADQKTYSLTQTAKAIKASDLIQLTEREVEKAVRGGKLTAQNSVLKGNIEGYNSVTLTDTSAGNIINNDCDLLDDSKKTYEVTEDEFLLTGCTINNITAVETTEKLGASGSVKVTLSKKAEDGVTVGNIEGYSTVVLTGNGDKKVTAGDIKTVINENNSDKSSGIEDGATGIISGKSTEKWTDAVAGSVKLTDTACKNIEGFKTVTLKNASISGAAGGIWDEEDKEYNFNSNGSIVVEYTTADDGKITCAEVETVKNSVTGSFTATDSEITQDGINGFKTVKLTNTSVAGDVVSAIDSTENYECELKYDSFTDLKSEDVSGGWEILERVAETTGSFTFTLDKKCDQSVNYTIGNITDFATVKISGYRKGDVDKGVQVTGNITNSGSCESYGNTDHDSGYFEWEEQTANGSVTLKDHVTVGGTISGFQKVSLTDSSVNGDVYSMDRMAFANKEYNLVYGELTMIDSYIGGDISGFKKFTAKDELNTITTYTGTAAVEVEDKKELNAETVEISKKATLIAEKIELQAEDKLIVNGELIFWRGDSWISTYEVVIDESVKVITGGLTKIDGKGSIYANSEVAAAITAEIQDSKANIVDLGSTSYFFQGAAEELDDNKEFNDWDSGERLFGWVGKGEFTDDTDKIIFRWNGAEGEVREYGISGYGEFYGLEVSVDGEEWDFFKSDTIELAANTDYEFVFKRTEEGSTSYMITQI